MNIGTILDKRKHTIKQENTEKLKKLMNKNYIVCIIPARQNSKGIKNKNIQKIKGKELIKFPFELATNSQYINEIIFSSDSKKYISTLKKINKKQKKKVHFILRPKKIATDSSTSYSVIDHALKKTKLNATIVVLLEPTSPLTTINDLDSGIKKIISKKSKLKSIVSIISNSKFNSFYKTKINKNNKIINSDKITNIRRQKISEEFVLSGNFYISKISSLKKYKSFISDQTYGFKILKNYYTDIDDYIDLKYANLLFQLNSKKKI